MDGIKERCKVEREVLFYGDDGRVVAMVKKYSNRRIGKTSSPDGAEG